VTSEKLASLSVDDLYLLADRMGLDLPPGLERVFVLEEILAVFAEDSEERLASRGGALRVDEMKYSGSEPDALYVSPEPSPALQRRYNETMIRALVRDPSWAFAYWDISDAERSLLRCNDSAAALFLRVTELDGDEGKREFFDIPISYDDLQWYINLPRAGVRFRIDLCARHPGSRLRSLARSNVIEAPRQALSPGQGKADAGAIELLRLSGLEELHIEAPLEENPQRILRDQPEAAVRERR
jgi:hypothetical protein